MQSFLIFSLNLFQEVTGMCILGMFEKFSANIPTLKLRDSPPRCVY